ncbi:hypothetical protein R9208_04860 [Flammeovirgaceae bacterium SG7u.132]|nr:hypothetical protein [Flammeovirgaceae bacterium SG7u.132]
MFAENGCALLILKFPSIDHLLGSVSPRISLPAPLVPGRPNWSPAGPCAGLFFWNRLPNPHFWPISWAHSGAGAVLRQAAKNIVSKRAVLLTGINVCS